MVNGPNIAQQCSCCPYVAQQLLIGNSLTLLHSLIQKNYDCMEFSSLSVHLGFTKVRQCIPCGRLHHPKWIPYVRAPSCSCPHT